MVSNQSESDVNPYAPTTDTRALPTEPGNPRHPARWPLLITGALFLVPTVMVIVGAFYSPSGSATSGVGSIVLGAMGLVMLGMALMNYTRLNRILTLVYSGLVIGLLGLMSLQGFTVVTLIFFAVFGWILVVTAARPAYTKADI